MKYSNRQRSQKSSGRILVFGLAVQAAMLLLCSMIAAVISSALEDPTGGVGMCAFVALLVGGGVSGIISSKYGKGGKLRVPVLSALAFVLVLLLIGLIAKKGMVPSVTVINLVCYMAVFCLFSVLAKGRRPRRRR